jgi:hypothetical protein
MISSDATKMEEDQWQAARVIKNSWKRYRVRKRLKEITTCIEQTRDQVQSLQLYQRELSLVHASNLETWKNERKIPAAQLKDANPIKEHPKSFSEPDDSDNVREHMIKLIESRICQEHCPDFTKLNTLLGRYSRHKPFKANGSLIEMQKILENWDELELQDRTSNDMQYKKELAILQGKWWEIEDQEMSVTKLLG